MKILILFLLTINAHGKSIKDYAYYKYDLSFTNPICSEYSYDQAMISNNGNELASKPKNVYCKKGDKSFNENRSDNPHGLLKALISSPDLKSIFLTFLSFSNSDIAKSLCHAISRGVEVTFIIDSNNEDRDYGREELDFIANCAPPAGGKKAVTLFRGNRGGLGYAHNKIIMADYKENNDKTTIVFSSGNMSSGTTLHHENWHFLTTSKESYFYQAHDCVRQGMLDENISSRRAKFKKFLKGCRDNISVKEEDDIKTYFVPSDGKIAMDNILMNMKKASSVDIAVHRFTHPDLINGLVAKKDAVRFISDDDLYWTGIKRGTVGSNMIFEYYNLEKIQKSGAKIKFMETNEGARLLHHNKFIIFNYEDQSRAVHTGAGNFTKAAFSKNFENYYFITIPEITQKFARQYHFMFDIQASSTQEMPNEYVLP